MVKEVSKKPVEVKPSQVGDLYSAHDPLPVPEAIESDSDTVWALWEEIVAKPDGETEPDFQSTERADLLDLPPFESAAAPKRRA
ncbi:MAG: hypothetical protein WCG50_03730 [Rhodoferax sp.]|uniref:hypothetical protein n=1 Tax=Rhodoferax sp. TaxID=50421 RepID=UPI003019C418